MIETRIEAHADEHPWTDHEWAWRCYYVNGVLWARSLFVQTEAIREDSN